MTSPIPKIGLRSAIALVIANMIGAGIFTTTGFQVADLGDPLRIFGVWICGGILALCGALCYGELGAAMPHSGGEYVYLNRTYGPLLGFMSAFVSLFAGFSAPIAAAIKGFVSYSAYFLPVLASSETYLVGLTIGDVVAVGIVWALVAVHMRHWTVGFGFNDVVTMLKVAGIVAIILAAFAFGNGEWRHLYEADPSLSIPTGSEGWSAIATSLIFVMFCYSGWNASAYVASEIRDPQRLLPKSLLLGTIAVTLMYLGLNAFYFYGAGSAALAGQPEVGLVAARQLFGQFGILFVTILVCVSIIASASAMIIAGPRVYFAFGQDFRPLKTLAERHVATGVPRRAMLLQGLVTTVIVLSGRIDQIQQYAGFTLALFGSLAVSCVLVLRWKAPEMPRPFKTFGYPWTPLIFLAGSGWMMIWAFRGRPAESGLALLTVFIGGVSFYAINTIYKKVKAGSREQGD